MRTYLAVIDDTPEAQVAVRFAARRAARTGGAVQILALVPPADFVAFGGVQDTIEQEAREHAEQLVGAAAREIVDAQGIRPRVEVQAGDPVDLILAAIRDNRDIDALVLGAAATGDPGPLVTHFSQIAGQLSCPLMIVPGGLASEALDRLS